MTPEQWQQVARLFDEAFDLEPQHRSAFLAKACAGDDELRRNVETMFDARERAGDFLNRDAAEIEASWIAAEQSILPAGQRVGHFEVIAQLGAGAMGDVYLAVDTRLKRQIALKLLPARFTQDLRRLRRFELEACAASALNHPNIITVYETGTDGDHHFIAAEFVAGQTLRDRLTEGSLPHTESISIASQIASALEAAHNAGIVHRDIKPENIMLRPDGTVKVLDFGIAKLVRTNPALESNAPSALSRFTEEGMVIGTPGYMSPEQARGLEVDARTDVFSLGAVFYEMISGSAPFRGSTKADVIAALLEREPDSLRLCAPNAPVGLDVLVARALAKDLEQRYQSAGTLLADLRTIESGEGKNLTPFPAKPVRSLWARLPQFVWAGVILACVLVAIYLTWHFTRRTNEVNVWKDSSKLRFTTPFSTRLGLFGDLSLPSFTADGKRIAFSSSADGHSHLSVKDLGSGEEINLTDKLGKAEDPLWSPDGAKLAFISERDGRREICTMKFTQTERDVPAKLREVKLDNNFPLRLLAWQPTSQGERIYYQYGQHLFSLNPKSGQSEQLTSFDAPDTQASKLRLSPNGDRLLYIESRDNSNYIILKPLKGKPEVLLQSAEPIRSLSWFPDEQRIAFISRRNDIFQIHTLHINTHLVDHITFGNEDYHSVTVAPTGTAILAVSSRANSNIFAWDFSTGGEIEHTSEIGLQIRPESSPDGKSLLFQVVNNLNWARQDIYTKAITPGSPPLKLSSGSINARWSPNGQNVAFIKSEGTRHELWSVTARGSDQRQLATEIVPATFQHTPYIARLNDYAWSPDGSRIAYNSRKSGASNLWIVTLEDASNLSLTNNLDPNVNLQSPSWSPDGKKLAYLKVSKSADQKFSTRSIWLNEAGKEKLLFQRQVPLQIIGWANSGRELLVSANESQDWESPQNGEVFILDLDRSNYKLLLKVTSVYPPTLKLARDWQSLVMVSRKQGRDNLELISLKSRALKTLTHNTDPAVFYSSPTWTADGHYLFYGKQTSWQLIHLLETLP